MKNIAIIVAAGIGSRVGGAIPKQFLKINGKEVLSYSLETFSSCNLIDEIVLVINSDYRNHYEKIVNGINNRNKINFVNGGQTRQESVKNAIDYVSQREKDAIILVHDAARPFVSERIIKENIKAVEKSKCCTTAIKSSNSIYMTEDGKFVKEVNRNNIYIAQTPQSAYLHIFKRAYAEINEICTDEAALFEKIGFIPHIVEGEEKNKKVTFEEDLQNF